MKPLTRPQKQKQFGRYKGSTLFVTKNYVACGYFIYPLERVADVLEWWNVPVAEPGRHYIERSGRIRRGEPIDIMPDVESLVGARDYRPAEVETRNGLPVLRSDTQGYWMRVGSQYDLLFDLVRVGQPPKTANTAADYTYETSVEANRIKVTYRDELVVITPMHPRDNYR